MKVAVGLLYVAAVDAFVANPGPQQPARVLRAQPTPETDDMNKLFEDAVAAEPSDDDALQAARAFQDQAARAVGVGEMSAALPFMARPEFLDGTLAGDVGFDPLGLATSRTELYNQREAEVKHGRLAMLAAAGWPLAELWDGGIARALGLPSPVDANGGFAPSVLNGGLGGVSPLYWAAVLGFAAAVDVYGQALRAKATARDPRWMFSGSYIPGDYGFDPLQLYPKDTTGRKRMQLAEIKHGRLAMIAITAFAVQEAVSKTPVISETPMFFRPVFSTGY